jgi:hypothetical protein
VYCFRREAIAVGDNLTILQPIANGVIDRWGERGMASLLEAEKIFLLVWSFGGDADNGGLEQFFFNSMGGFADQAVDALRAVGANHSAATLAKAIALFGPSGVPTDLDDRSAALESLPDEATAKMEELSEQYLSGKEEHDALLVAYVAKHQEEFQRRR